MTIQQGSVTAVQRSRSTVEVAWLYETPPTGLVEVERVDDGGAPIDLATLSGTLTGFTDTSLAAVAVGTLSVYTVTDLDAVTGASSPPVTINDPELPFTYGVVNVLQTAPRYTTVDAVKKALNIDDLTLDTDISQAIVAAEVQIDQYNGRAFPDTGDNPQWAGVPDPISVWALSAAIGTLKLRDQVYGSAGTDEWLGSIDVAEQVRRSLTRNPMALGFRVTWGIA